MSGRRLGDVGDGAVLLVEAEDVDGEGVDAGLGVCAVAREVLDGPAVGGAGVDGGWS